MFDHTQITALLSQKSIVDIWPWSSNDEDIIENHIQVIVEKVTVAFDLIAQSEFARYGSGYASFVDAWFYRADQDFRFAEGNCFWGMVILFSRLSNYFVVGEAKRSWDKWGSVTYCPSFEMIDQIHDPAVLRIVDDVSLMLNQEGFIRLSAEQLAPPLVENFPIPTILSNSPFRHFDVLFYWAD